ncbi:MAG: geranylgeranylglycerol-phosphate geranylgeranyltransferase [Flavitalea sp.]
MKPIAAFLRLIRSVNLLFIFITQLLFQYAIIVPMFGETGMLSPALPLKHFLLLSLSSVLIAAAGYIINDYFDLNIDKINRPGKIVVEKAIRRRWAIVWHWVLSLAGVVIGFYVGWRASAFWLGFANAACVGALWFYSTTFKRKILSGNIIISLLTAWVVLVIGFVTHYRLVMHMDLYGFSFQSKLLRFTFLYAGFAFIICLVREVVKDIEDMEGDAKYGCRTMPIVWGVNVSKVFAGTWLSVITATLIIVFAYILQFRWWVAATYCALLIILPLINILIGLYRAKSIADYHRLSKWIKFVMFTGIVSMIFIWVK